MRLTNNLAVCGIATSIGCGIVMYFVEFQKFSVVVIICAFIANRYSLSLTNECTGLVGSSVSDILITASLVFHLVGSYALECSRMLMHTAAQSQDRLQVYGYTR